MKPVLWGHWYPYLVPCLISSRLSGLFSVFLYLFLCLPPYPDTIPSFSPLLLSRCFDPWFYSSHLYLRSYLTRTHSFCYCLSPTRSVFVRSSVSSFARVPVLGPVLSLTCVHTPVRPSSSTQIYDSSPKDLFSRPKHLSSTFSDLP